MRPSNTDVETWQVPERDVMWCLLLAPTLWTLGFSKVTLKKAAFTNQQQAQD